jgi:hypothetical protein
MRVLLHQLPEYSDHVLLRDFGLYRIIFMNAFYNRCHGNTVKGFWALWHNIYEYVCLLL